MRLSILFTLAAVVAVAVAANIPAPNTNMDAEDTLRNMDKVWVGVPNNGPETIAPGKPEEVETTEKTDVVDTATKADDKIEEPPTENATKADDKIEEPPTENAKEADDKIEESPTENAKMAEDKIEEPTENANTNAATSEKNGANHAIPALSLIFVTAAFATQY